MTDVTAILDNLNHPTSMLVPTRTSLKDGVIEIEEISYPDEIGAVTFHINLEAPNRIGWYLKKIHNPIFKFMLDKLPETTNVNSEIICVDGINSICVRATGLEKTPAYQTAELVKLLMAEVKKVVVKCSHCGHVGHDNYGHCVECGKEVVSMSNPWTPKKA